MKKRMAGLSMLLAVLICLTIAVSAFAVKAADNSLPEFLSDNKLPVISLTIDENAEGFATIEEMNSSPDHSVKCTGTVRITVPEGYTGDYSQELLSDTEELPMEYIRGRGHTTWDTPKKPYKFKLDKKADLLGMGKNKHWVLLANYKDETLLRNRIISYLGDKMGLAYTPKMLPVDLIMNGQYLGNYYLAEQVRVGKTRVNIDELVNTDHQEPEITGGYLLSLALFIAPSVTNDYTTEKNVGFLFDTPSFESEDEGTPEQRAYISNYLQQTEDAVFSGHAADYMDLKSAADYWWIQLFSMNIDAFRTDSTYLYKPRGDKLFWGPLWDFDLSLGRSSSTTAGFNRFPMAWLDHLRENDPEYLELLRSRWVELDKLITDVVRKGGVMDQYIAEIRNSWEDNLPYSQTQESNPKLDMEILRTWMKERQNWINQNLDRLGTVYNTVRFMADDTVVEQRQVYSGEMLKGLPDSPKKEGYTFMGWEYDGELINEYDLPEIWKDSTIRASFKNNQDMIQADHLYFNSYDVWASYSTDPYSRYYYSMYTMTPEDAENKDITWSSSHTDIAEVDKKGIVSLKAVGAVTITATLSTGVSNSYTLHIYDDSVTPLCEPESITVEQPVIRMKVGDYTQIVGEIAPQPCNDALSYYCEDEGELIEMLDYGVIKALAPGTTTVTLSIDSSTEASCTVIITDGTDSSVPEASDSVSSKPEASVPPSSQPENTSYDSSRPDSSKQEPPVPSASEKAFQTGDNQMTTVWWLTVLITAGMIVVWSPFRKRKNR